MRWRTSTHRQFAAPLPTSRARTSRTGSREGRATGSPTFGFTIPKQTQRAEQRMSPSERIDILDNIAWHTLVGPHAKFAAGHGKARRYARGFSPIVGFADAQSPDFDELAAHCEPGEHFYCDGWSAAAPQGWRIDAESTMIKIVGDGKPPEIDEAPDAIRLGPEHATEALELATLTRPGPFGP